MEEKNFEHFIKLSAVNVGKFTEKKNNMNYLTWSIAWQEVKKVFPDANYEIVKDENYNPYFGNEKIGYMVFTKVTIENITHEMWLPVMDGANKSMKDDFYEYTTKFGKKTVEAMTTFDINKAIMRCLTKNLAMFGMGINIYSGEDFPDEIKDPEVNSPIKKPEPLPAKKVKLSEKGLNILKLLSAIFPTTYKGEMEKIKTERKLEWDNLSDQIADEIIFELQVLKKDLESKIQSPNFGVSTTIHFDELDNSKKRIFALLKELFGDGAELQREKMKFDNGIKSFSEMNLDLAKKMISELESEKKIREIQLREEQF